MKKITQRELQVLRLAALEDKDIARVLKISTNTVKELMQRVYNKMGVKNRTQAVVKAQRLGFLNPSQFPIGYENN